MFFLQMFHGYNVVLVGMSEVGPFAYIEIMEYSAFWVKHGKFKREAAEQITQKLNQLTVAETKQR
jgi:hypothetical protein